MTIRKIAVAAAMVLIMQPTAYAGTAEGKKWVNDEFQPSTLSKQQQISEMEWFDDVQQDYHLSETVRAGRRNAEKTNGFRCTGMDRQCQPARRRYR